jgi:proteasome lid subunit RPN8/RPN11
MEKFVGWYHSHPFDVESYSHCHLSHTDVQTQFAWQSNSPFWVAIVVRPPFPASARAAVRCVVRWTRFGRSRAKSPSLDASDATRLTTRHRR